MYRVSGTSKLYFHLELNNLTDTCSHLHQLLIYLYIWKSIAI